MPYAAMFPGLLTEGIERAESYIFRGIVADSVRGLQFLMTRRELDATRVVVMGNDMALITAALAEGATHVVTAPALFYKTIELAPRTQAYPLEEINDYLGCSRHGPRPCATPSVTTTCARSRLPSPPVCS